MEYLTRIHFTTLIFALQVCPACHIRYWGLYSVIAMFMMINLVVLADRSGT